MGQAPLSPPQELEYYVIRLEPAQSILLYGYMLAKTTLTWKDTLQHPGINLRTCTLHGVDPQKLCRMQPDIREWLKRGKATLEDSPHMGPWKPDVFGDLGCNIGDLVVHRRSLAPQLLIDGGVTFTLLKDRYGLTPELMALLKYSPSDWVELGVPSTYLGELSDDHWVRIFGNTNNRCELIELARRRTPLLSSSSEK
jgi:hypothetical protein